MSAGEREVEFTVMVIGGGGSVGGAEVGADEGGDGGASVGHEGNAGREVLGTEEFWVDLGRFLEQRLGDRAGSEDVLRVFRRAWKG